MSNFSRDNGGNLAQLSKHNLGGTIQVPNIERTSVNNAERDRYILGQDDLSRLCKTFGACFASIMQQVDGKIHRGMTVTQAISWAKAEVMQKRAKPAVREVTEA